MSDLRDYIDVLKKRRLGIVLITLVVSITAGIVIFLKPPVYQTYALIKIGRTEQGLLEPMDTTINVIMSESTLS